MKRFVYPGDELNTQQGISVQVKEVVMDTHLVDTQYFLPEIRKLLLRIVSGGYKASFKIRSPVELVFPVSARRVWVSLGFKFCPMVESGLQIPGRNDHLTCGSGQNALERAVGFFERHRILIDTRVKAGSASGSFLCGPTVPVSAYPG